MDKPRIHHIAIHVQDPKKEAAYYKEVIKLEDKDRASSGTIYLSDGFIAKDEFKKTDRRLDSSIPQHQTRRRDKRTVDPRRPGAGSGSDTEQRWDTAAETGGR
jgi:hypothetical protein